jgi:hypothetical protein
MGYIEKCTPQDIPDVANLHAKVFYQPGERATEQLRSYYMNVFFNNPWYEEDFSPLVYRTEQRNVAGFMGVISRPMTLNGKLIRVVVAHRLMVAPDSHSPLAALKLLRTFFSYPYDLAISDGANDSGKKFWEGMGGNTTYLYSMNWVCPLRPCCYTASLLKKMRSLRPIAIASWPICYLVDLLATRIWSSPLRQTPPGTSEEEINDEILLSCISEFSKGYLLRPEYDSHSMTWILDFLRSNKHRGTLSGFAVRNEKKQLIGAYLYYLSAEKIGGVMFLVARNDSRNHVLEHLLYRMWHEGAICVFGRLEPKFLKSFWDYKCLIKRGSWALIHAKDPEIINIVNRGDAFISVLEGELWLRSPTDRL